MPIPTRCTMALSLSAALAWSPLAPAQSSAAADPVLVENSTVKIRKSDYELELQRLPADIRPGFANSERRVNDLLRRMLIERTLAAQARAEKLDEQPENARKLEAEVDRMRMLLKVAKIEADAAAEFDAKRSAYEARARELYTVDRSKYATPEQFFASHILFETKSRSKDEALKLAREARAKVLAGEDFNKLAREVSEDASAKRNFGKLDWFTAAEMDPGFSAGVAGLKNIGDVSEPVLSTFGWHIVKLEGRRPAVQKTFEQAREQILGELKQKYINEQRESVLAKVRSDPTIKANREAIDALVIRVDPEAVRRAIQQGPPGAPASTAPAK
jgi:peptidyl-prolyl cis-trans isomerase C